MRFFPKPNVRFAKKHSTIDKNTPSYEEILIEVEKQRLKKLLEKKNKGSNS